VRDQLTAAIQQRKIVTFTYQGHERRVQPTAFGQSRRRHKDTLQGYQVGGGSSRGDIPHWRSFFVEQITGLQVLDEVYGPNPPGFVKRLWMEVSIEPTTAAPSGGSTPSSSGGSGGGDKKDQVIPGVPITADQAAKAVDAAGKAFGKLSKWLKNR
jgi:hypothetical protein